MDLSNVSILNMMPPNLAADHNVKMMAEAFDETLRGIIKKIPNVAVIPNLVLNKIADEVLIDLLAWQFHVDFYDPKLPIEIKRELVLKSLDWHYRKGTPSVVEEIVSAAFKQAEVEEWHEYGGLPYRFRVTTDDPLLDQQVINEFIRAINSVKNTRSLLEAICVIKRGLADAYAATVPAVNEMYHLLAKENEAHAYFSSLPVVDKHFDILASENEAYMHTATVPEAYERIDVLASENDALAYTAVVPTLKFRVDILSAEGGL